MKTTILISSIAVIFGSIMYLNKPTEAIGSGVNITRTNNSVFITECPVVGNGLNKSLEPSNEEGVAIYEHCKDCNTGVYLSSKEDIVRCTFCGKEKS